MSKPGYSDPLDHAFAFVAKHHPDLTGFGPATTNRSANLAVTLARYGCDEPTIVAGVLLSLMDACPVGLRSGLEAKVNEKFGPAVFVSLRDATEPRFDPEGRRRGWRTSKQEFLVHLLDADPRALDVVTANEIHWCGSSLTAEGETINHDSEGTWNQLVPGKLRFHGTQILSDGSTAGLEMVAELATRTITGKMYELN